MTRALSSILLARFDPSRVGLSCTFLGVYLIIHTYIYALAVPVTNPPVIVCLDALLLDRKNDDFNLQRLLNHEASYHSFSLSESVLPPIHNEPAMQPYRQSPSTQTRTVASTSERFPSDSFVFLSLLAAIYIT